MTTRGPVSKKAPISRKRRVAIWVLILLAALITLVSSLTVWVKRQLLDTDQWVSTSSALLQEAQVRSALSIKLVDALFSNVDVQAQLEERLPAPSDALAAPAAGALRQVAVQAANTLLADPRVQSVWEEANRRAHERLIAVLEGNEGGRVTTSGGDVVLDLSPLVVRLQSRLGVEGELPTGTGQITILHSDGLEAAQKAVRVIKVLTVFLGLVVLALLALAVYLARGRRRETIRAVGAALLVVGILLLVIRRLVGNAIVEALTSPATKPAGNDVWLIATDMLRDIALGLVVYGALALLAAWLAGPTRPATWVRRTLAPTLRERPIIVYGAVFVAFLLALLWGPFEDNRRLIGVAILAVLLAAGVGALRRQTAREFPPLPDTTTV